MHKPWSKACLGHMKHAERQIALPRPFESALWPAVYRVSRVFRQKYEPSNAVTCGVASAVSEASGVAFLAPDADSKLSLGPGRKQDRSLPGRQPAYVRPGSSGAPDGIDHPIREQGLQFG